LIFDAACVTTVRELEATMTEEHRSPLHAWHEAQGAEVLIEDGWPWYMHEGGDPLAEYEAIRTGTGIWDLFSTCKYEVTGPDAERLIQRRFTNSLAGMASGQVRYGAFVNADGLMVDDGNVYKHDDEHFWMMINTADLDGWFRETASGLDAQIAHRTEDFAMIAVQGPTSQATLQGLTGRDLDELGYFRFWPEQTTVAGVDAWVLRTGFSGEKGYEVVMAAGDAQRVWDALIAAGGTPFGLTAVDLARTEVGLIIIAVDYNPADISPWDLSMDRFIKTDTENVGADALARYGQAPPKRFKTLKIEGEAMPDYGAAVTKDGKQVGTVTSPAVSPRLGTIGLAIVDADVANDGEKVEVAVEGGSAAATVEVLSLLDPRKERPRA
jgi:aminomethyltransferase